MRRTRSHQIHALNTRAISEACFKYLQDLKNKDEVVRLRAARNLKTHVVDPAVKEMTAEEFSNLLKELNRYIQSLVNASNAPHEQLGGIAAIDAILDVECEEFATLVTQFSNYLRSLLPTSDTTVMVEAAKALGHLARAEGTLTADVVEFEIKRALENLVQSDNRRYAAVVVLKELAQNAPTLFYVTVPQFLKEIWGALRDSRIYLREAAVEALRACLALLADRPSDMRSQWYKELYDKIEEGFVKPASTDSTHASLLALGEILRNPGGFNTGGFLVDKYNQVCQTIFNLRDHKDDKVRKTVISQIPLLASFAPDVFQAEQSAKWIVHLKDSIRKAGPERPCAFIAIGELTAVSGDQVMPHLDEIFALLKDAISSRTKAKPFCPEALTCVSLMVQSLGPNIMPNLYELLDFMFMGGLTTILVDTLKQICVSIPCITPDVQGKLINAISFVLAKRPFTAPSSAATKNARSARFGSVMMTQQAMQVAMAAVSEAADVSTVELALHTLRIFKFDSKIRLVDFLHESVVGYLDNENSGIRRQATLACSMLLLPPGATTMPIKGGDSQLISEVLERLIIASITDPDASIRLTALSALDSRFDFFLAQSESIRSLFVALNDEVFEIREVAIQIIGRLTRKSPAYVMPSMRKTLIQLLTEMEFAAESRNKEESARLIGCLIRSSGRLTAPYVQLILKSLVPKLRHANPTVATCVLSTLGELAMVDPGEVRPHKGMIMELIIESLHDQSNASKRELALRTLGQIVESTVDPAPYREYPQLLRILTDMLAIEVTPSIRVELLRVIGIAGALDPNLDKAYRKAHRAANHVSNSARSEDPQIDPTTEDFYPAAAIAALTRILRDSSLSSHHNMAIQSLMYILKQLGPKIVFFLPSTLPPLLTMLRMGQITSREYIASQLALLISFVKKDIRPYMEDILSCIHEFFDAIPSLQPELLRVVEEMTLALGPEFNAYLPGLIPLLLQTLGNSDARTNGAVPLKVLRALEHMDKNLDDYLHLVIPSVVKLVEMSEASPALRVGAVQWLGRMCRVLNFSDYVGRIVHPLAVVLDSNHGIPELRDEVMFTLCSLIYELGASFAIFNPLINRVMVSKKIQHFQYESLMSRLLKNQPIDRDEDIRNTLYTSSLISPNKEKTGRSRSSSKFNLESSEYPNGSDGGVNATNANVNVTNNNANAGGANNNNNNATTTTGAGAGAGNQGNANATAPPGVNMSVNASGMQVVTGKDGETTVVRWLRCKQDNLRIAWEASQRSTKEDWTDWMRRFSVELLRESPSPALRSCSALAQLYHPLARELFNAAFVSCWGELNDKNKESLVRNIDLAISMDKSPNVPFEVLQVLLNLLEFMEHDEQPLPININKLALVAEKCQAYAKALRYKEIEFLTSPEGTIQSLISINNQLGLPESAQGILQHAHRSVGIELQESWYEKLHRWEEALEAYERKLQLQNKDLDAIIGSARCLQALGEWERMSTVTQSVWSDVSETHKSRVASLAATAAWHLGRWDDLEKFLVAMPQYDVNRHLFNAILNVHRGNFEQASEIIAAARGRLDTKLTALVAESYARSYNAVVQAQELAELEEIIQYKQLASSLQSQEAHEHVDFLTRIQGLWDARISKCKKDVTVWQNLMAVRSLVIPPSPMAHSLQSWLQFAQLCVKNGRFSLAHNLIKAVAGGEEQLSNIVAEGDPRVVFALLKYEWAAGDKQKAFDNLLSYSHQSKGELSLQARLHYKLGEWRSALCQNSTDEEFQSAEIKSTVPSYEKATGLDPSWYKGWHGWASANLDAFHTSKGHYEPSYVVNALKGFFMAISLDKGSNLQDTLRLLTLAFSHGDIPEIQEALNAGIIQVPVTTWLGVVPQLIARISTSVKPLRRSIQQLLIRVGKEHPQALIYPLAVAAKSASPEKRDAAESILHQLRAFCASLVEQAQMVSEELIRVSVLWLELWHEALEEASKAYFVDGNTEAMAQTLIPMYELMDKGASTMSEIAFVHQYGQLLADAYDWINCYQKSKNEGDLNQAWDRYYSVFRGVSKQLPLMMSLQLEYVSPKLLEANELELAIPGTYKAGYDTVAIKGFGPTLSVMSSKQRPRKCTLSGNDGNNYVYLLKGHEDLRQDERVMQLFALVNTLLANSRSTSNQDLSVHTYSVIPLSPTSGILEWVPNCDTLHSLISGYRTERKIQVNIEHRLMQTFSPKFDSVPILSKVETFKYALENTTGMDLQRVLWLKSRNSEEWLERRTNYTRTLAVMSMVGYILGLGDRHPSNIMLQRYSGKIMHIDFGDCFEVAMNRDKFPEKIPFRLTRMLISAMEVCGIEGIFRVTCENVMKVLRDHRGSVMAVLEAFIHDPLINWRLLAPEALDEEETKQKQKNLLHEDEAAGGDDPNRFVKVTLKTENDIRGFAKAAMEQDECDVTPGESLNKRALEITSRINNKLTGRDFDVNEQLSVESQVNRLINQATSPENLAQGYIGWCPFW